MVHHQTALINMSHLFNKDTVLGSAQSSLKTMLKRCLVVRLERMLVYPNAVLVALALSLETCMHEVSTCRLSPVHLNAALAEVCSIRNDLRS